MLLQKVDKSACIDGRRYATEGILLVHETFQLVFYSFSRIEGLQEINDAEKIRGRLEASPSL